MDYATFKNLVREHPLISAPQLAPLAGNRRSFNNQISNWKQRGLLVALKKGVYLLNENDRKVTPSREFVANQLAFPSYVSLEYALSFHGLIPERVYQVTSVTTKKTQTFENPLGAFAYRSLRSNLFFGFQTLPDENGMQILMAEKEKAVLDLTYLNLAKIKNDWPGYLQESLRIDDLSALDAARLSEYCARFQSQKLRTLVSQLN